MSKITERQFAVFQLLLRARNSTQAQNNFNKSLCNWSLWKLLYLSGNILATFFFRRGQWAATKQRHRSAPINMSHAIFLFNDLVAALTFSRKKKVIKYFKWLNGIQSLTAGSVMRSKEIETVSRVVVITSFM
jgi:hypothetical protein